MSAVVDMTLNAWTLTLGRRVDRIGFHKDGTLSGVRVSDHEHRWVQENEKIFILDRHGSVSLEMLRSAKGFQGYGFVQGKKAAGTLIDTGIKLEKRHYRERANDRILTESRLGASRDFIFVSFNSMGKPFSGILNEWEMFHLPNILSVDYIRFSATNTPRSWYVDKIDRIYPQLAACALMGYKRFIFCGMSAGGYAALLFSELIAENFPDCCCRSISFNPTLLVGEKHFRRLQQFSEPTRSSLPRQPLFRHDGKPVDIPDLLEQSDNVNISHEIHFDDQNEFELYQTNELKPKNNVKLIRHSLGVGHGAGTVKIYRSGAILSSVRQQLPELFPSA